MNDRSVEDYESEAPALAGAGDRGNPGTADLTGCSKLSELVPRALAAVPRHRFVPPAQLAWAYADSPLPIGLRSDDFPTLHRRLDDRVAGARPRPWCWKSGSVQGIDGDAGQFGAAGVLGGTDSRAG